MVSFFGTLDAVRIPLFMISCGAMMVGVVFIALDMLFARATGLPSESAVTFWSLRPIWVASILKVSFTDC